jgi:hypothetical protein
VSLEAELFPKRRPTGVRVWVRLADGRRVKLLEHRGLGHIIALGNAALGQLVPPPAPRPRVAKATARRRAPRNITPPAPPRPALPLARP